MNTDKTYAEKIASEYAQKQTSKTVALKKLDAKVKRPAEILAYTIGIVATLLFGAGMAVLLKAIGNGALWQNVLSYVAGAIGIVGVAINYPIYKKVSEKRKRKYAADVIRLAKEISDEE